MLLRYLRMEMSASMSKKIQSKSLSSSLRKEEEILLLQKQGIVTILGSDCDSNRVAATSLRRTLSADMSSKKWLSQNGLSPMKRIASSEELSHTKVTTNADSLSSSSEGEDYYQEMKELDQIWSSIQQDKKEKHQKAEQFDLWSSILPQKGKEETSNSLSINPYIHPLVKRSKNCLSQNSLEICTESLGSESGSDGSSSYPQSEIAEHSDEDKEEKEQKQLQQAEEVTVQTHEEELQNLQMPKYNYAANKSLNRSFPPSLPSLHVLSYRDNGRLLLQAVFVPSQNNFCAKREDGRLVLTFASEEESEVGAEKDHVVEEMEENFVGFEEDDEEEEKELENHEADEDEDEDEEKNEVKDVETVIEQAKMLSSGISITSVDKLALVMNKPKWSEKFNESLLPRPSLAAASFSAYEHYWKTNSTAKAASLPNPLTYQQNDYLSLNNNSSDLFVSRDINQTSNDQQQLLVLRGKNGDYMVHNLKSCKDSRRSFLFWESYCIAT